MTPCGSRETAAHAHRRPFSEYYHDRHAPKVSRDSGRRGDGDSHPNSCSREIWGYKPVQRGAGDPFRLPPGQDGAQGEEGGRASEDRGEGKGAEGQEGRPEGGPQPQEEEDPHVAHFPQAQDAAAAEAAQIPPEERPPEKQAGPLCHYQVPSDHRISHEED